MCVSVCECVWCVYVCAFACVCAYVCVCVCVYVCVYSIEQFVPMPQDGSCNGLQHYAALGRDGLGAKQVNLTPGDRPEDPYAGVATMVW